MQPTVTTTIEPLEPTVKIEPTVEPKAGAPRAYYTIDEAKVTAPACTKCPVGQEEAERIGMAFAVGAIIGVMLVFAFSKQKAVTTDA